MLASSECAVEWYYLSHMHAFIADIGKLCMVPKRTLYWLQWRACKEEKEGGSITSLPLTWLRDIKVSRTGPGTRFDNGGPISI